MNMPETIAFTEDHTGPSERETKYMVFKTEELFELMGALALPNSDTLQWTGDTDCAEVASLVRGRLRGAALDGAVVIRTHDVLAGPALHGYAAAINVAISILTNERDAGPKDDTVNRLRRIADYLVEKAIEADDIAAAGNAKLPD